MKSYQVLQSHLVHKSVSSNTIYAGIPNICYLAKGLRTEMDRICLLPDLAGISEISPRPHGIMYTNRGGHGGNFGLKRVCSVSMSSSHAHFFPFLSRSMSHLHRGPRGFVQNHKGFYAPLSHTAPTLTGYKSTPSPLRYAMTSGSQAHRA